MASRAVAGVGVGGERTEGLRRWLPTWNHLGGKVLNCVSPRRRGGSGVLLSLCWLSVSLQNAAEPVRASTVSLADCQTDCLAYRRWLDSIMRLHLISYPPVVDIVDVVVDICAEIVISRPTLACIKYYRSSYSLLSNGTETYVRRKKISDRLVAETCERTAADAVAPSDTYL